MLEIIARRYGVSPEEVYRQVIATVNGRSEEIIQRLAEKITQEERTGPVE